MCELHIKGDFQCVKCLQDVKQGVVHMCPGRPVGQPMKPGYDWKTDLRNMSGHPTDEGRKARLAA